MEAGDRGKQGRRGAHRATPLGLARVRSNPQSPALLSLDGQRVGHAEILTAVGEIDINSAEDLRRALATARDGDASEIWVDLRHTTFIDCSGLHALLDLRASLVDAHRRLALICPAGPVLRLLVLTGTDREFEIHATAPPRGALGGGE